MTSNASRLTVRRVGNSNSLELVPNSAVRRNHIRVRKGLGLVHRSPRKKRSQAHHAVAVTCPLKDARRKALQERFSQLKGGSSNTADVSAAETTNDNPMDVDDDYVDIEDGQPAQGSREPHKHKRDTQGEAQRLYDAWRGLIPSLVLPFLAYMNKSACSPTANTFEQDNPPCSSCASDSHKTTRVLCLFWDHHETIDVKSCNCRSLTSVLVDHGFFPTAPNQPRLAISIDFLELYHALFEHTGDAVTAISAALSKLYTRRGYSINNKKGEPIRDPFRRAFGSAVQWYDCLKVTVRRSVENAIETAHNNISSPPRPVSSGTAPEYEDTEGRQPSTPDVPSYHKPSSTEAARLLQKRCPACFGGRMKGRSFDDGGDCHVATDGNFHHRHLSRAPDSPSFYDPDYFISKAQVDVVGDRVEQTRQRPPRKYKAEVPDAAIDECQDSHEAADGRKEKTSGEHYDDRGLMALVCRHDIPLFFANIDSPGEQQKYAIALIEHLYTFLPKTATVVVLYDVGCVLDRSLQLYDILPLDITSRLQFATSAMHAFGHQWACQLIYNPRLRPGLGLTDGEGTERLWSRLRKLISITRGCARSRRIWLLDRHAHSLNSEMREGLGDWIGRRLRLGVNKQGKVARAELLACGIPIEVLREQWKLQQAAQLSLRSHAPVRLKKELDKVLTLQGDIDAIESALSSTRTTIARGEVPDAALSALSTLERTHSRLSKNVENLYASLNVHESFPELNGFSLDFVRTLFIARDLKINIRKRAIANFFEREKLDRAVGGKQAPLGTKLHQQTRKAIQRRTPALMAAIRKFNKYCDALVTLSDPTANIPLPRHLSTDFTILRDDPYLMEDVWVHSSTAAAPPWLTDTKIRKGIRAMLKIDRCTEEYRRIGIEADNLCRWFGQELAAIELAIQTTIEPLLIQPLLRERTLILRLQTLWVTPLTPKHVFPFHVQHAVDLALHISGKPQRPVALHWLPLQVSPSTQNHEDYLDKDDNANELEDIPCLDPSQAMLADVIMDDSPVELTIDSVWIPSAFIHLDNFRGVRSPDVFIENPVRPRHRSASGDFRAISFGTQDLSCLLTPSRLNDVCINDCASLLQQLFDGPHAEQCAILSTYSLANHRGNSDDDQIWRVVKVSRFWTKPKWILPIHRPGGSGHWVLCVINTVSHHIDFFDSFADAGNWLPDIKDALSLIFRLVRIAITKSYLIDMTESGWTASPTSVDCLQTNGYDCGVWVLASIAAVLRGFDVTGFSEADMPWFRQFLSSHILTLPMSSSQ